MHAIYKVTYSACQQFYLGIKFEKHYDDPNCLCLVSVIWCIQIGYPEYDDTANCKEETGGIHKLSKDERYQHYQKSRSCGWNTTATGRPIRAHMLILYNSNFPLLLIVGLKMFWFQVKHFVSLKGNHRWNISKGAHKICTSSTHSFEGSFASSRTPFIKDLNPFSGDIRYGW